MEKLTNHTNKLRTPWKFISSPLKIDHPKRKGWSSNYPFFRGFCWLNSWVACIQNSTWGQKASEWLLAIFSRMFERLGGGNSNIFTSKFGEDDFQFDEFFFWTGWFNHQPFLISADKTMFFCDFWIQKLNF